jgi:hypothetical protein
VAASLTWGAAALAIPGFVEWFYPEPLIVVLVVALIGSWIWSVVRLGRPTPADQARLDRILSVATRDVMRHLDHEDFTIAWREEVVWALRPLLDLDHVEDRFEPSRLEACRSRLVWAVAALLDIEASNSWDHERDDQLRYVGVTSGQADGGGFPYRQMMWRAGLIHEAAGVVVRAYDDLLRQARVDGFALEKTSAAG